MTVTLDEMMIDFGKPGSWVRCSDRQPPAPGDYYVIKRGRSRHYDYDTYHYNGGYWVTNGHSLSNAVEAWFEEGDLSAAAAASPLSGETGKGTPGGMGMMSAGR